VPQASDDSIFASRWCRKCEEEQWQPILSCIERRQTRFGEKNTYLTFKEIQVCTVENWMTIWPPPSPSGPHFQSPTGALVYRDIFTSPSRGVKTPHLNDDTTPDSLWFFLFLNVFYCEFALRACLHPTPNHLLYPPQFQIPRNNPAGLPTVQLEAKNIGLVYQVKFSVCGRNLSREQMGF